MDCQKRLASLPFDTMNLHMTEFDIERLNHCGMTAPILCYKRRVLCYAAHALRHGHGPPTD